MTTPHNPARREVTDSKSRPLRFAVQGGPFGTPAELADHARMVESLGYCELFSADHVGSARGERDRSTAATPEPFAPLLVAASATTSLRLGPLVLNNELYNPALLARTAATVDRLTGGRLVLGVGTGYSAAEHDSIGDPIRPPGARVSRLEESLTVVRSLLDTGAADHDGQHESIHITDLGVAPMQQRVPILVGGHGRRVVGVAARHADVFQFTGLTHAADGTPSGGGFAIDEVVVRSNWLREAAGERAESIERSVLVQFSACGDDVASSSELAQRFAMEADVIESSPFVLCGSLQQLVDKIGRLRELLGVTHYVVRDAEGFAPVVDELAS